MPDLPLAPARRTRSIVCRTPKPSAQQRFQNWLHRLIRRNRSRPHPRKYLLPPLLARDLSLPDQYVVISEHWSVLHVSTQQTFVYEKRS
jgi:hypothetical protein